MVKIYITPMHVFGRGTAGWRGGGWRGRKPRQRLEGALQMARLSPGQQRPLVMGRAEVDFTVKILL
jgi:hypothetical protein